MLQNRSTTDLYTNLYGLTVFTWLMYPIVLALGEYTAMISSDAETVAFLVLDLMAKVVFGLALLSMHNHVGQDNAAILPEWLLEIRGNKAGAIQLPVGVKCKMATFDSYFDAGRR